MKYLLPLGIILLICCQKRQEKVTAVQPAVSAPKQDSTVLRVAVPTTPYWGYRFKVEGDFDGNGTKEMLYERFYSQKSKHETYKYLKADNANGYDCTASLQDNDAKKAMSYMVCSDSTIRRMSIGVCSNANAVFGISFMKNVGDLNGDGTDELVYMDDRGCTTDPRFFYLLTYKDGEWKKTRQWRSKFGKLPVLPEVRQKDQILKQFSKEIRAYHKELIRAPSIVKKKKDKVYYCEFDDQKAVWKEMKINW